MSPVAQAMMNSQPVRLLLVVAGSVAAFIVLAFLIYWLYFSIGDAVYDRRLDEGLTALQVLFYTAFALHMLGSLGAAGALIKRMRAPIYPTLAVVLLIFAVLALPMLMILSFGNFCENNVSFPIPGQTNC